MLYPRLTTTLALAAMAALSGAVGCSRVSEAPKAQDVVPAPAPEHQDGDEADPTGTLVVRSDLVRKCTSVRTTVGTSSDARDVLHALSSCMTRGELRRDRILVTGGSRETGLVQEALARVGVPSSRVERVLRDRGDEVELAPTSPAPENRAPDLRLSVHRSDVVGLLVAGDLLD